MAYTIPGLLIIIGSIILVHASTIPQYTDPAWDSPKKEARWNNPANDAKTTEKMALEWYEARQKVLTSRDQSHDVGMALVLMGASIAGLFGINCVCGFGSIGRITSPKTKLRFFLLAAVTWLFFACALAMDDKMRFDRREVPVWCEPTPTANALVFVAALVTLPIVLFGVQLAVWKTPLPVELSSPWRMRPVSVEPLILIAILLNIYVLYIGLTQEVWVTPPAVVTMYLLLSGRATANHPKWSG